MASMLVVLLISLTLANALPHAEQSPPAPRAGSGDIQENLANKEVSNVDNEYQVRFSLPGLELKDFEVFFGEELAEIRIKQGGSPIIRKSFKLPDKLINPYWTYDNEDLIIHLPVIEVRPGFGKGSLETINHINKS